jgi:hypothetical protein
MSGGVGRSPLLNTYEGDPYHFLLILFKKFLAPSPHKIPVMPLPKAKSI